MINKLSILLLVAANSFAQINFVTVQYGLKIGYDEGFSNSDVLKDYYAKAQSGADLVNFELVANKTVSYFKMIETIKNEETDFASSFSEASTSFYTEADSNSKIRYENDYLGEFRIIYSDKTEWKLVNESKYIDSYLCYKATSEEVVVNSGRTFKYPIVAWYCPSIPFSYGPKGYNGLPGLILELQVRNITWGAAKIELSKEDTVIARPTKGKLITEEEYIKMLSSPPLFSR
jgi:GLPGLI family protein